MFGKAFQKWAVSVGVAVLVVAVLTGLALYLMGGALFGSNLASSVSTQQQGPPQFPRMELQAQYSGPLQGTMIQRWRDPVDGTTCYIYLPMVVQHTPAPSGYVQYGSNTMGSISCLAPVVAPVVAQ